MGATFVSVNRVRVGVDGFLVRTGPLHGHFQAHVAVGILGFEGDNLFVHDGLRAGVQEVHVVE